MVPVAVIVPPVVPTPPETEVTTPAAPTSWSHAQPLTAPVHFNTSPGAQSSAKSILLPVAASVINRRFRPPPVLLIMAVTMRSLRIVAATDPEPEAVTSPDSAVIPVSVSADASHADPLYFNTCPGVGATVERLIPRSVAAFINVKREPSTAGICEEPFNCKIWLAPTPVLTDKVPVPVILPPSRPAPPLTKVTVPPALLSAAHSHTVPFHFKVSLGEHATLFGA